MDIQYELERDLSIIEKEHILDKKGLIKLLASNREDLLFTFADRVRKKYVGEEVHLRGLIEFSNYCSQTCTYCGLRHSNKLIKRYRMDGNEIIECAKSAVACGLKTIVLQSGEDKVFTINELCRIVEQIKNMDVAITLSIGELTKNDFSVLKKEGVDRYLMRIETSNEKLYEKLHPGMSYKNRVRCLNDLKELGYETGTGSLIGVPGQTLQMLAEDLLFFKRLDADMIGIGPFIPCVGTPLEYERGGDVKMVLKMLALIRLLMPDINIPATTALGILDNEGYIKGLKCGANVIMPNMGITEYRKLYKIYPGRGEGRLSSHNHLDTIRSLILNAGRIIGNHYGFRK